MKRVHSGKRYDLKSPVERVSKEEVCTDAKNTGSRDPAPGKSSAKVLVNNRLSKPMALLNTLT
ncbi:hypothetical protein ABH19_03865 [Leptospirillum sp. Group II 'CF-1']|nr:hypothetical protein ABH19_03865 [Leptospirillum sp. Group II 'CF-1']